MQYNDFELMQGKPTFKNLMNIEKEKTARDRPRSKSPDDRSLNRSNNKRERETSRSKISVDRGQRLENVSGVNGSMSSVGGNGQINRGGARGILPPSQSGGGQVIPQKKPISNTNLSSPNLMPSFSQPPSVIPQPSSSLPHLSKITQLHNKLNQYQLQFKKHQNKLNKMFNQIPSTERFQNEQTQILSQSRFDSSQKIQRLEEKFSKPLFLVKTMGEEFRRRICEGGKQRQNGEKEDGRSIREFHVEQNYSTASLNLGRLQDRLNYLQSLI